MCVVILPHLLNRCSQPRYLRQKVSILVEKYFSAVQIMQCHLFECTNVIFSHSGTCLQDFHIPAYQNVPVTFCRRQTGSDGLITVINEIQTSEMNFPDLF